MGDGRIQWHPAFSSALRITLQEDEQYLHYEDEHLLGKKPMQVDILIIKKNHEVHIKKSIGHIFRKHNLIEYKSPEDYFSVNDIYKVCGYACFYKITEDTNERIAVEDITISIVCNHYPREVIQHIKAHGMKIEPYDEGIYYLKGGIFPMQLIISKQLSKEAYYWIQSLRMDLNAAEDIREIGQRYEPHKTSELYQSVINVVLQANRPKVEVEKGMEILE